MAGPVNNGGMAKHKAFSWIAGKTLPILGCKLVLKKYNRNCRQGIRKEVLVKFLQDELKNCFDLAAELRQFVFKRRVFFNEPFFPGLNLVDFLYYFPARYFFRYSMGLQPFTCLNCLAIFFPSLKPMSMAISKIVWSVSSSL